MYLSSSRRAATRFFSLINDDRVIDRVLIDGHGYKLKTDVQFGEYKFHAGETEESIRRIVALERALEVFHDHDGESGD